MPQSQIELPAPSASNVRQAINKLGHLASGLTSAVWGHRNLQGKTFDTSAGRAVEWCRIAGKAATKYYDVPTGDSVRYPLKSSIHSWLRRKHAVLPDALKKGDILQTDVLNAVLEIDILELEKRLGGEARPEGDEAVKYRNNEQQASRTTLEERHGAINKAFEGWYLNQSSHSPDTKTVEETALEKIRKRVVERLPEGGDRDMCVHWAYDMAEMTHRMHKHWTKVEKVSLHALLNRFEDTLNDLLTPPHVESAYHPAARQHAADPEKVVELFEHWNAEKIRDRVFTLALPFFETNPGYDEDIENQDRSNEDPAWLDKNWYRRLGLP